MIRTYYKTDSKSLGREMEMLVFGHAGLPVLAFPTSTGRFFQMEDFGMIAALAEKIDQGQLQIFCMDSVDSESWYNRNATPRGRIHRQLEYEKYVLTEVVPLVRDKSSDKRLFTLGCSFGGYHAMNIALRHPEIFTRALALSGTFDLSGFLHGYYDLDCYYNLPTHYLPNLTDPWYLHRYARNDYVLATGWDDHCLEQNCDLDRIFREKAIPHQFYIWEDRASHGWAAWNEMARQYL